MSMDPHTKAEFNEQMRVAKDVVGRYSNTLRELANPTTDDTLRTSVDPAKEAAQTARRLIDQNSELFRRLS